jgi:GNAT superfamily N-acetyltransferase
MSPTSLDEIQIRAATPSDVDVIHAFIGKKAAFDRSTGAFSGTITTTPARIAKTLFGEPRFAHALLAHDGDAARGFALFYFRYSSFAGLPSLWLDDLYVDADVRSHGVGARLLDRLRAIAAEHGCSHLGWTAAVANPRGQLFYQRHGATVVTRTDSQLTYRLDVA